MPEFSFIHYNNNVNICIPMLAYFINRGDSLLIHTFQRSWLTINVYTHTYVQSFAIQTMRWVVWT